MGVKISGIVTEDTAPGNSDRVEISKLVSTGPDVWDTQYLDYSSLKTVLLNTTALTTGYHPYWDGSNLVTGPIFTTAGKVLIGTAVSDGISKVEVVGGPVRLDVSAAARLIDTGGTFTGDWTLGAINGKVTWAKSGIGDELYFYTSGNTDSVAPGTYLPGTKILRVGGIVADWATYTNDNSVVVKTNGNTAAQYGIRIVNTALADLFKVDGTGAAYVTTSMTSPQDYGSSAASGNKTIGSTSHGTKGKVYIGSATGFVYDEVNNRSSFGKDETTIVIAGVTYSSKLSIHSETDTEANIEFHRASATASVGTIVYGARSKGSLATPTTVASNDNILDLYALGYDGTDFAISSAIEMEVDNTVAANQVPGRIKFSTANASGTLTEAFRIDSTQYGIFATGIRGTYLTASELLGTDANKNIISLAVATYPSLTELSYVKGLTSAVQTQLDTKHGYCIDFGAGSFNPLDATVYYAGGANAPVGNTTANSARLSIPKTGTIKAIYINIYNGGTLGSNETSTMVFRLNNTTDTSISASITTDAVVQTFSNSGLSISVSAGDTFEIKWTTPTWATNPTAIRYNGSIYVE